MLHRSPLFLALLLNLFFLALYFAFGIVRHGSLDDYFMSSVLTGAYGGGYDVHMYFVNAAYGYFLKPFYALFPRVGWYFIFELAGTFAAFTTFTYFLIQRMGAKMGLALSALLLAALTPDFYFQLSFTQCATIYTAAGILTFFSAQGKKGLFVLGSLFLIAGSIMRWDGFLLGMPYLAVFLAISVFFKKNIQKKEFVAIFLCITAIYTIHTLDRDLYTQGEYKQYAAYQGPRSFFGDGAYYDKESTFDELQERGFNGADLWMLKKWVFYDTEVFSVDSLRPIIDIADNNRYALNPGRTIVAFFLALSGTLTSGIGWCWVLFCLFLLFSKSKESNFYPWLSLGIIALSIGYLLLVNRLAYHVVSGIWLYSIVCSIPFTQKDFLEESGLAGKRRRLILTLPIVLSILFAFLGISGQSSLKKQWHIIEHTDTPTEWREFMDYAEKNKNDVFLLSFEKYKDLGTYRNPPYKAITPQSWQNIFSWGYWNIYLPAMKYELSKRDITNPIRDIIHDNVYTIEDDNKPSLRDFYQKHYHDSLWVDTVEIFGKLMLLKYHSTATPRIEENKL